MTSCKISDSTSRNSHSIFVLFHISKFFLLVSFPLFFSITDLLLSLGVAGISALSLVGVDVPALLSTVGDICVIGTAAKFVVAFPITYHFLAGVRHLKWDKNPEILDNDYVTKSSYLLAGSAVAISAGLALL